MAAEMEGRLTILRSQLEGQKAEEIARITQQSQEQMEAINGDYQKDLERLAQEIVGRMIGI